MRVLTVVLALSVLVSCSVSKIKEIDDANLVEIGGNNYFTFASMLEPAKPLLHYPDGKKAPEADLNIEIDTVSKCHPGDLDQDEPNFWKDVDPAADAVDDPEVNREEEVIDTTKDTVYTVSIETFDGRVMGSKKIMPKDLVVQEHRTQSNRVRSVVQNMPITILPGLADGEAFPVNLFMCIDANKNGKCADEAIININEEAVDKTVIIDAPVEPVEPVKKGKLLHSVQMMAAYRGGQMIVQDLDTALNGPGSIIDTSRANGAAERAKETNEVVQDFLKNIKPADPEKAANPLAMAFVVQAKNAPECQPKPAPVVVHRVRTNGCFIEGTIIEIAKEEKIPVEQIGKGVEVLTANKKLLAVTDSVAGPEKEPVIVIKTFKGHKLTVTSKHPVMTKAGMKLAKDITLSDELFDRDMKIVQIKSLSKKIYKGKVYNFAMPGKKAEDHMVIANGLIVGDLFIQQKMTSK